MRKLREFGRSSSKSTRLSLLVSAVIFFIFTSFVFFAEFIAPYDPCEMTPDVLEPPKNRHLFGTDILGRDIYSRIIYGTRCSLLIALTAVIQAACIGSVLGVTSGYMSGKIDHMLLIVMDALYSCPSFIVALVLVTGLGHFSLFGIATAVAIAAVPTYFRVMRSITLSIKERTFIEVERSMGAGSFYIILRHILPRCLPEIVTLATLGLADAITTVAGLGFLGLGIQPPTPEWGADLSYGRRVLTLGVWWPSVFSGLMVCMAVLCFNLLGEATTEMLTPELKRR